jgi:wobble nucleotide-excising tRNase
VRGDDCPFCGQPLSDRALVDAYKDFFSAAYKALAENVRKARETFARYRSGEFRTAVENLIEQNVLKFGYWREAGKLDPPDLRDAGGVIAGMEDTAAQLDAVFQEKQANLTQPLTGQKSQEALTLWDKARTDIVEINASLGGYLGRIKALKDSIDPTHEQRLENELNPHPLDDALTCGARTAIQLT